MALSTSCQKGIGIASTCSSISSSGVRRNDPERSNAIGQTPGVGRLEDVRLSFNQAVDVYDDVRPSYPQMFFEAMFEMLPAEPVVVEVGPGTGQATKDLLARGASVHAIELGPATAARLRSNLASDRLQVTVADFETVEIPPSSADAVFAASAYHWVSAAAQVDRPAHLLRPGGLIAVIELVQVDSPADHGFFAAAQPIYDRYGQSHFGPPAPTRDDVEPPIRRRFDQDARFERVAIARCDWDQTYTSSDYRKLMLSYSGTQTMEVRDRDALLDDIQALVESDFGGQVTRPLVATLTTAALA
ncbi:MAG: SAM-dependent methyltransferase [Ilumatobacteraceae bacterium]|nr:SAM-dependent methyltransferase [Ilumatobacteraceae bacterium]